jgi:hypothetical protein
MLPGATTADRIPDDCRHGMGGGGSGRGDSRRDGEVIWRHQGGWGSPEKGAPRWQHLAGGERRAWRGPVVDSSI